MNVPWGKRVIVSYRKMKNIPLIPLGGSKTLTNPLPWNVLTGYTTQRNKNVQLLPLNARRQWHPTPVLLPRKSHGRRSLEGCSSWGRWGSDTTERPHFHFSLSHIGEGNGNPLQCSCLENPRDGGAWWAAVCGVSQSRTRLKRLSSNSSTSQWKGLHKHQDS